MKNSFELDFSAQGHCLYKKDLYLEKLERKLRNAPHSNIHFEKKIDATKIVLQVFIGYLIRILRIFYYCYKWHKFK